MGDPAFLPLALRLLGSGLLLAAAAACAFLALRASRSGPRPQSPGQAMGPGTPGPLSKARAHRPGRAGLAALIEKARVRPYARDLVAERLRTMVREAAALQLGLDEAAARAAIEEGCWDGDPRVAAFLGGDFLAPEPRRHPRGPGPRGGRTGGSAPHGPGPEGKPWVDFAEGLEGSLAFLEDYASPGLAKPKPGTPHTEATGTGAAGLDDGGKKGESR